ncbi:TPA: hypothetical protein O9A07_002707 [Staphylococcus aureus]|nr:hypothetical protein [Staphylococcus aureus]
MFGDQRQEATKYVIKEGYQDIYFLNKNILRLAMKKSMTIDFFIAIFYSYREE